MVQVKNKKNKNMKRDIELTLEQHIEIRATDPCAV